MLRWFGWSLLIFGVGAFGILAVQAARRKDLSEMLSTLLSIAVICTTAGVGLLLILGELPLAFGSATP
jgi:hypothetical protein